MRISTNSFGLFKTKRQKFGIGSALILLFIGLMFTGIGSSVYKLAQIDESWTRVDGQVIDASKRISDGSTTYTPIVEYQVNEQKHQVTSGSSSSSYPQIGSTREVAYNPARPDEAKVVTSTGTKLLILLFPAIGIGLLLLTPILYIRSYKRTRSIQRLIDSGQKLQGILVDIHTLGSSSKSRAYKIIVSATDMYGEVRNFESDKITGIAGLAMADFKENPIPIDVYVDQANPANYYVDLSDIPNLTPERIKELVQAATQKYQQNKDTHSKPTV